MPGLLLNKKQSVTKGWEEEAELGGGKGSMFFW